MFLDVSFISIDFYGAVKSCQYLCSGIGIWDGIVSCGAS